MDGRARKQITTVVIKKIFFRAKQGSIQVWITLRQGNCVILVSDSSSQTSETILKLDKFILTGYSFIHDYPNLV